MDLQVLPTLFLWEWSILDTTPVRENQDPLLLMFHYLGISPAWASVSLSGKGDDNPVLDLGSKGLVG